MQMQIITNLFIDTTIDQKARSQLPQDYLQTYFNRSNRHHQAFINHMVGYLDQPKPTLTQLQSKINFYNQVLLDNPNDHISLEKLENINNQIANQDYAIENSIDYDYNLARINKIKEFKTIFPDNHELSIRETEENDILMRLV